MTRYSVQPNDRIFLEGYGFLSFARNIGKKISKNLGNKYSQKLLDLLQMHFTLLQKEWLKKQQRNWWFNWK